MKNFKRNHSAYLNLQGKSSVHTCLRRCYCGSPFTETYRTKVPLFFLVVAVGPYYRKATFDRSGVCGYGSPYSSAVPVEQSGSARTSLGGCHRLLFLWLVPVGPFDVPHDRYRSYPTSGYIAKCPIVDKRSDAGDAGSNDLHRGLGKMLRGNDSTPVTWWLLCIEQEIRVGFCTNKTRGQYFALYILPST